MQFPQVVVINMARHTARRRALKASLKTHGFTDITWINAVDGGAVDPAVPFDIDGIGAVTPWPGWIDPYARRAMTMGEVGCSLSHIHAWRHVARTGVPAIILEDDAVPVDGVIQTMPALLNDLSYVDFNLVFLAQRNTPPPKMLAGRHVHVVDYHPLWTLAYLISAEAAAGLLEIPWQDNLCPADEMLPAAFGLNDKGFVNERLHRVAGPVLAANQRFFTPREGSQTSETEKSPPVRETAAGLTCFTVASDDTPELQRLVASGARYGVEVEVLGLGRPWKGGDMSGPGGGQKVNLLRAALKGLPAARPVLFVDGYDVVLTRHILDMLAIWRDSFDSAPVFAAEVTCWPDANRADEFPELPDDNPYRFLNSGAFIGRAGDLRKLVAPKITDSDDDQCYYTERFLETPRGGKSNAGGPAIQIDSHCRIFQCLNHSIEDVEVDLGRGMLYNRRCDSWPTVIHANGPSKDWLEGDGSAVGGRWRRYYGDMT